MTRPLSDYIPSADTREFIREIHRRWGVEWAATLTQEISEGVLVDMGDVDFYPCPTPGHAGINIANRPCYRCNQVKPEAETAWKYSDRGWREKDTPEQANPRQMSIGEKHQPRLEGML